jgi:uncharacterized protein DUF6745
MLEGDNPAPAPGAGDPGHPEFRPPGLTAADRIEAAAAIDRFRALQGLPRGAAVHWTRSPGRFMDDTGAGWWEGRMSLRRVHRSYWRHLRWRHRVLWVLRQTPAALGALHGSAPVIAVVTFFLLLSLCWATMLPAEPDAVLVYQLTNVLFGVLSLALVGGVVVDELGARLTDERVRAFVRRWPEVETVTPIDGLTVTSGAATVRPSFRPGSPPRGHGAPAETAGEPETALLAARATLDRLGLTCAFLRYLTVVLESPETLRVEVLPHGARRLHGDPQPAAEWRDGSCWYALHGVRVEPGLLVGDATVEQIHSLRNSEVRRIAIERMGWTRYLAEARLASVAEADDPANPGGRLQLFDLPDSNVRLLAMRNGSPDRSGATRTYVEPVPRRFDDPVAAAAWQYGCHTDVYRTLQRRT